MKFLNVLLITLFATTLFWGCSDDDDSTAGVNSSISLSTGIVQVDKKGGEVSVTVTSSGYWRLAGVCDWAHPSVTSGKNGDVVTFTVDSNEENVYRCCTFKFFVGAQVAPLKIESYPGYVMQLLSEESLSFSRDKDILTIKLNTFSKILLLLLVTEVRNGLLSLNVQSLEKKYLCNSKLQPMKPIKIVLLELHFLVLW